MPGFGISPLLFPAVTFFFLMKHCGYGASPPVRVLPAAQGGSNEFGAAQEGQYRPRHLGRAAAAIAEEMAALGAFGSSGSDRCCARLCARLCASALLATIWEISLN